MGQGSQSGHIGFKTQVAAGAFLDPGAADPDQGIFALTRGGSLSGQRDLIEPDPEIGGYRDTPGAVLGPISYSGTIEWYARMEMLATLFYAAFGDVVSTPTGVTQGVDQVGSHVITPIESSILPLLSVEEHIGESLETFRYTDCAVNAISLELDPDGYFMGSSDLIALTALGGVTPTAVPETDSTSLMVGTNATVTIGGVTTDIVRSMSLEFTNNLEDDVFELGSITLADLTAKRRELTFNATIRPVDAAMWREAVFGSSVATGPINGAAVTTDVALLIESFVAVGSGVPDVFSFEINIPVCHIEPFEMGPSGDDVIEFDVNFKAARPLVATPLATVTIVNDLDAVR